MDELQIREPEFVEIKALDLDNPMRGLSRLRLGSLLMEYNKAVVAYYDNVREVGDCRRIDPTEDDGTGTDQQRALREHAPLQKLLWAKVSLFNGEILRRVYAGKDVAIRLLEQMRAYVEDQVALDASVPPTEEELKAEAEAAEKPPFNQ